MVAGLRKIDLDDVTLEVLTNWREFKCKMTKMIMFLARFGNPLFKSIICRMIKRQAEIVDVPRIPRKGLSYSHSSYLLNVPKMSPYMFHIDQVTLINQ